MLDRSINRALLTKADVDARSFYKHGPPEGGRRRARSFYEQASSRRAGSSVSLDQLCHCKTLVIQ
jgi:hypothetical protein